MILSAGLSLALAQDAEAYTLEPPGTVLNSVPFSVSVTAARGESTEGLELVVADERYPLTFEAGEASAEEIMVAQNGPLSVSLASGDTTLTEAESRAVPGWFSILPPLLAILIALITRQVIPALFFGVFVGAAMSYGLSWKGLWLGLLDTLDTYVLEALAPPDGSTGHAAIILFTLMIGGMVGIISRNGGMKGVVNRVSGFASSPKRGQLVTSLLGVAVFFDDYANTLVVGNTMRPITDRLKISREKLAYIVDSTAAPVATIGLVTTWIGFEVGLIGDAISKIEGYDASAYALFLNSIPYSFYPLLAVAFVFMVSYLGRDFGPMLHAERRARQDGKLTREDASVNSVEDESLEPKEDTPERALNAIIPIIVLVAVAVIGLFATGEGETIRDIIGSADSFTALIWASLLSVLVAIILSVGQRILSLEEAVDAWFAGLKNMLFVILILVLAWALAGVTDVLHTGDYLVSVLGDNLSPALLPSVIFIVAAATAFATGTSWGTMGILIPLTVPLAWAIMGANGLVDAGQFAIMYASVSAVMAGAVWGDHCSPISDTTIISSMAARCDHIDHVRTQAPYALVVGGVALALGLLPVGFGVPWWLALAISAAALVGILFVVGRPVEGEARSATVAASTD